MPKQAAKKNQYFANGGLNEEEFNQLMDSDLKSKMNEHNSNNGSGAAAMGAAPVTPFRLLNAKDSGQVRRHNVEGKAMMNIKRSFNRQASVRRPMRAV